MKRMLSNSEIDTALTCWAKWDFQYGGHLAGSTLKSKIVPAILSRGSAWGAAMQAYHRGDDRDLISFHVANSIIKDQLSAESKGVLLPDRLAYEQRAEVMALVDHYAEVHPARLQGLQSIETDILVPIPSAAGGRSNKYTFQGYFDWWAIDPLPQLLGEWIVETKLRSELHSQAVLERSTQLRWYAWAYYVKFGRMPDGVIVDTWLALVPNEPRMVKAKRKYEGNADGMVLSTAKDQVTTIRLYQEACRREGIEPDLDLIEALGQRAWGNRSYIPFTRKEVLEAGRELVTAAALIHNLDTNKWLPIRHASPRTCGACRFKGICTNPGDKLAISAEFARGTPKRLLPPYPKKV